MSLMHDNRSEFSVRLNSNGNQLGTSGQSEFDKLLMREAYQNNLSALSSTNSSPLRNIDINGNTS